MERDVSEEHPLPEVTVSGNKRFKIPITIEPIVFGLFLADTLSESIIQNFILMRTCIVHFHHNQTICNKLLHPTQNVTDLVEEVQPYAAVILTAMSFISKLFPAFLALFIGPWSDYNGRKLMLVLPAIGYCIEFTLLLVYGFLPKLGPEYGLVAVIPVALSGGFTNFVTGVYAYISDVSKEENRLFRLSLLESVMYSSVYVGLLSSSYLLKLGGSDGYTLVYGLCIGIVLVTVIPTIIFVPESVQSTESGRGLLKVFDTKLIADMFKSCFKKRENNKRCVILLIIACLTISLSVGSGNTSVFYLYTKLRYGWDIHEFTIWASVLLASSCTGIILVSAVLTKWFKIPDVVIGMLSYIFNAIGTFYVAYIPSRYPNLMYFKAIFAFLDGLTSPVGRSILSKSVPKEDLGKVFALIGATEAIFPLATGPLYTALYNSTIRTLPNAFLFVTGSFYILCTVFFVIIYVLQKRIGSIEHERLVNEPIN